MPPAAGISPAQRDTLIDMETPGSGPADVPPDAPVAPPSPVATGPVWRFIITPRWIGWHLLVVAAFWGMLELGDWQLRRALAGNGLSWAYTLEWPLFAGFAVVFWWRTIRDEFRLRRGTGGAGEATGIAAGPPLPAGLGLRQAEQPADDGDDIEVANYNAYLAKLNGDAYLAKLDAEVRKTHGQRGSR